MEEIDLKQLFNYFINKLYIVIIVTSLVVILGVLYSLHLKVPMYRSDTTLVLAHVSSEDDRAITQSDISLNRHLVSTYREIVTSRIVLDTVIDELGLEYKNNELANKISVSSIRDTEVIKISVVSEDNVEARNIANSLASAFSSKVLEIYSIRNISVIDEASVATSPYNVNFTNEVFMYVNLGVFASLMILLIIYGFDNTIKSENEIEDAVGLPVLGVIPVAKIGGDGDGTK